MSDWEAERAEENDAKRRAKERFSANAAKTIDRIIDSFPSNEQKQIRSKLEEEDRDSRPLLPEEKALATELHDLLCRWNHIDGCGWHFNEITDHEWNREYSHIEYIKMARIIIAQNSNAEETIKTLQLVKAAKKAV